MASSKRRMAADARRIAGKAGAVKEGESAAALRRALGVAYDRGREDERAQIATENAGVDVRRLVLSAQADGLERAQASLSGVLNSGRSVSALGEAISILRDALAAGETPTAKPEPTDA